MKIHASLFLFIGIVKVVNSFDVATVDSEHLEYSPIIATKSGKIRGRLVRAKDPKADVYAFTGIPFAEPPTGERRYRKPVPLKSWAGDNDLVLDATKPPSACLQSNGQKISDFFLSPVLGSEDCLYLNIYVPKRGLEAVIANSTDKLLSTFVFIHGGAFLGGSANTHNGTLLAGFNNIIAAAIQYRIGSLGFAYYGTDDVPGNMGLWDQVEALKWLYENLEFFGGNSSEITIGGQSAGAASVTFHLLSPHSRQYFQKAIVHSGTAISPWAAHTPQQAVRATDLMLANAAQKFCNEVSVNSSVDVKIRCLKSLDGSAFPRADVAPTLAGIGIPFTPVIDGDFLPRDPHEMLQAGDFRQVPLLIGATKDEGSPFLAMLPDAFAVLPTPEHPNKTIDDTLNFTLYRSLIASMFRWYLSGLQPVNSVLMNAVELQYWPQNIGYPRGPEIVQALTAIVGDNSLLCPTFAFGQQVANFVPQVYTYYFTHRRAGETTPKWMGVMHGAELPFLFGQPFDDNSDKKHFTSQDGQLSLVVMNYWANFIKYGDPNNGNGGGLAAANGITLKKWPTMTDSNDKQCKNRIVEINYLKQLYCSDDAAALCDLKARDCMFWSELYPKLLTALTITATNDASEQATTSGP